ncbi:ribose ABC transporter permease [Oribacterium sp. oral taxon 102]|uniref:ABC transporter permease n=1 Tax=Oribacterium sp. oral taxon 102 TaxID=671214 RepID=UPI0015B862EE|nr:ribose ABC transporter permease [Oribacterium sp. oral taxon 102]NWO21030.1 ribose ABC transporter permease [Oribacterium sp. oral taxon 102]
MNKGNKRVLITQINIYRSVLILLFICIVATILSENFLSVSNLFNVIRQVAVGGLVACGMTFVILTGGIDLSVGSIVGLTGALSAGVLRTTENMLLAILVAVTVGILCGMVNGFFVAYCGIPAFIATLGMMTLLRGCVLVYTQGSPIAIKNAAYKFIGKGSLLGIPLPIVFVILFFLLGHYVLTQTPFGRAVYALGGSREAARLAGIRTKATEWAVYTINGFMCSVAGIVLTSRLASAQSTGGEGIEMDAIAAVILGGTSLSGGSGFILPTVVGAIIMGIIDNLLTLMKIDPHATNIVKGAVILLAVLVDKKVNELSARAEV